VDRQVAKQAGIAGAGAFAELARKEGGLTRTVLEAVLPGICGRETSANPEGWSSDNPLWGHCAVVSVLAQDVLGGKLLRASLEKDSRFGFMGSHYENRLGDGSELDFTRGQFGENYPENLKFEERSRDYVLYDPKTGSPRPIMERYKTLAWRFMTSVSEGNLLFEDNIYRKCFGSAMESSCQKMRFGVVILHGQEVVYEGSNVTLAPLKHMCEPKCMRLGIESRTEAMLGACAHAEELGIWSVAKRGIRLEECKLYVAGFHTNHTPYIKEAAEHTCLRCSTQMYNAGVGRIYVPVKDHWEGITAEEAVRTSAAYALGNKQV